MNLFLAFVFPNKQVGSYNDSVSDPFKLSYHEDSLAFLFLSRPDMFERTFIPFVRSQLSKMKGHLSHEIYSNNVDCSDKLLTSKPNLTTDLKNCDAFSSLFVMRDPIDECMKQYFSRLKNDIERNPELFGLDLQEEESSSSLMSSSSPLTSCEFKMTKKEGKKRKVPVECFFDFDMNAFRRPSILMQTAGHVSSAAFYFRGDEVERQVRLKLLSQQDCSQDGQRGEEIINEELEEKEFLEASWPLKSGRRLMGVSLHPKFGGWFAFRCVMIFPEVITLEKWKRNRQPTDVLPKLKDKLSLLISFNNDWKSGKYRDFIDVQDRYSLLQEKYFNAKPGKDRLSILMNYFSAESATTSTLPLLPLLVHEEQRSEKSQ